MLSGPLRKKYMAFLIKVLSSQNSLFQKSGSQVQLPGVGVGWGRQVEMEKLKAFVVEGMKLGEKLGQLAEETVARLHTRSPGAPSTSSPCILILVLSPFIELQVNHTISVPQFPPPQKRR